MVARGEGAPNILSVACIAYVQSALRPASVTLTRQIGSDKLISFTGDLGDLRIPGDSLFDILHAGPPPRFDSEESASRHPLCSLECTKFRTVESIYIILIRLCWKLYDCFNFYKFRNLYLQFAVVDWMGK